MGRKRTYEELEQRVTELEKENIILKHSEKEYEDSQKEISLILGNIPLITALVDQDRRITKLSDALVQFTGREEEDIIGLRGGEALRCIHHLDVPKGCGFGPDCDTCILRDIVLDTLATGKIYHKVEANFSFEDDEIEERTLLLSSALLDVPEKKVLICIEDITERYLAEDRIKEVNNQLKELNKNLMDAYAQMRDWKDQLGMLLQGEEIGFLINKDGMIMGVTRRALQVGGSKRAEIIGTSFIDLLREDSKVQFMNTLSNAWVAGFLQTAVSITVKGSESIKYEAKLMHFNLEGERALLLTMQDHN